MQSSSNRSTQTKHALTRFTAGDSVVANNKHYICNKEFTSGASLSASDLTDYFTENYVHMQDGNQGVGYMPEDYQNVSRSDF